MCVILLLFLSSTGETCMQVEWAQKRFQCFHLNVESEREKNVFKLFQFFLLNSVKRTRTLTVCQ